MNDIDRAGWRAELTQLFQHHDFSQLPSPVQVKFANLLAEEDDRALALCAERLLGEEPELRALYRRMRAAPIGDRGEVLDPATERKRPDRRWECPVPGCDYEDWGDRFHPALQGYCPRINHPRALLRLVP